MKANGKLQDPNREETNNKPENNRDKNTGHEEIISA
jgi:hypothetical protein